MKKGNKGADDIQPEYDFAAMKGGVRGKYAHQARTSTNIVLLEPDIAEAFPTEQSVNEALRGVLNITRAVRSTGGLSNKTLQPAARVRRSARTPKNRSRAARG